MALKMDPLNSDTVPPLNLSQVTQMMNIRSSGDGDKLRLRFKIQYTVNGAEVVENGDYE